GPRLPHRRHERLALLRTAHPLPEHVVALLGRTQYRLEIVSLDHLSPLSALGYPAALRRLGRVRRHGRDDDEDALHPGRQQDLVRCAAELEVSDARIPSL